MNKLVLSVFTVIGLVLLANSVFASTPQYSYTTDFNFDINGTTNQQIGKIIITKQPYIADIITKDNISNTVLKQYDGLRWNGLTSAIVANGATTMSILSPGQTYYFATTGTFSIKENGNESNIAQVVVQEAEVPDITLTASSIDYFTLHYDTRILMDAQEKTINISVDVPVDTLPKSYPINFSLINKYKNYTFNQDFRVKQNQDWLVVKDSVPATITVKAGDIVTSGEIIIDAKGNTDVNMTSALTGNGTIMLKTQSSQTLFRKSFTGFGVTIQVPQQMPDGSYNQSIVIMGGNKSYQHNITIVVKDTTAPEITAINYKDESLMHQNYIKVEAHDNIDVANVTISFTSPTHNINASYATKDKQIFTFNQIFTDPAGYNITICAIDYSNNTACNSTSKVFTRLVLLTYEPENRMPSRKNGKTSEKIIFNMTEKVPDPVIIQLMDFTNDQVIPENLTNSTNQTFVKAQFKIMVLEGDGNSHQLVNIGDKAEIKSEGPVKLQVWGDTISEYHGLLHITVPVYAMNVTDESFKGAFLNYDVPNAFSKEWFGKQFSCGVTDTGDLETSVFDCKVQFPISTNVEQLAVPTTIEERNLADEKFNNTVTNYELRLTKRNVGITILASLLIVALGLIIYTAVYHPYIRLRTGGS